MKTKGFRVSEIRAKAGSRYEYGDWNFYADNFNHAKEKAKAYYEENIDNFKTITIAELKEYCTDFDIKHSDIKGKAVLKHILGE